MLLIMDIPTEVDNDAVMTFLQEYCSEAIGRTQIGSNYMVLALVLMQTVGRMNGRRIQNQRVLVDVFNNISQGKSRYLWVVWRQQMLSMFAKLAN
jgi:hypothetical protein